VIGEGACTLILEETCRGTQALRLAVEDASLPSEASGLV
jgi:hypothetical protein